MSRIQYNRFSSILKYIMLRHENKKLNLYLYAIDKEHICTDTIHTHTHTQETRGHGHQKRYPTKAFEKIKKKVELVKFCF